MTDPLEMRRKRAIYRGGHRGTREMDLLVGGFAARHVAAMTAAELAAFEDLLMRPDADLYDLIAGRLALPTGPDGAMVRRLRDFGISAQ